MSMVSDCEGLGRREIQINGYKLSVIRMSIEDLMYSMETTVSVYFTLEN